MFKLTLRNIFARKLRLLTTSIAISFGVAFVAGALILGATINKTFDDLFANAYKNTDAVVRGNAVFSTGDSTVRLPIDANLVSNVKVVPGVVDAELSYNAEAQIIGSNNKPLSTGGAPAFADRWITNPKLNPFQIVEGGPPTADNQVVVDKTSATKGKLVVGQTIKILTSQAPQSFVISGIAKFGQVDSPAGASYALFDDATSAKLLAQPGKADSIAVLGDGKESQGELVNRIAASMPLSVNVITGKGIEAESQAQLKKDTRFIPLFLEIFGGITLFVGAFIINNTFTILLAQRLRETALLRAIGATRRQVLRSMIAEAIALGFIASVIGIVLGIGVSLGIKVLLQSLHVQIANGPLLIPRSAVTTSLIAGIGITLVSSVLPARRSSRVPPMAALRDVAIDTSARSVRRFAIGLVTAIIGAALITIGLTAHISKAYIPTGVGAALVFMGVAVMGPAIARPASWLIGWPLPKLLGTTGHLARENALRNPRRTSSTAAALMIGVAVVGLFSVLFTSVKVSTAKSVDKAFNGDFILTTRGRDAGVSTDMAAQLAKSKSFSEVAAERDVLASLDGTVTQIVAIDPKVFPKVINMPVQSGSLSSMNANQFGTTQKNANAKHWQLGQKVTVQFAQGAPQTLTLAATYTDNVGFLTYSVPLQTYERSGVTQTDSEVFIDKAAGVSSDTARAAVTSVTNQYPTVRVQDETEFKKNIESRITTALNIFYSLLGLAVLIALIGIANTLALSVLERTREIGLMRAVGMTRRQVRAMVRWESVIVALLGTILGLIIGIAFGWALVASLSSEGINTLSIPVWTMTFIILGAGAAGIVAAILPARRASKLNVIRAIASE